MSIGPGSRLGSPDRSTGTRHTSPSIPPAIPVKVVQPPQGGLLGVQSHRSAVDAHPARGLAVARPKLRVAHPRQIRTSFAFSQSPARIRHTGALAIGDQCAGTTLKPLDIDRLLVVRRTDYDRVCCVDPLRPPGDRAREVRSAWFLHSEPIPVMEGQMSVVITRRNRRKVARNERLSLRWSSPITSHGRL